MRFITAVFILAGMIIGVGMFATPFSFVQAGFWIGMGELALLLCAVLLLHILYAAVVLGTPAAHRMPGYARAYLGALAGAVSWASTLLGAGGTLLAYIAVGTLFLRTILSVWVPGVPPEYLAAGLTVFSAAITFFPLKKEAHINGILTFFEIAFIAVFAAMLIPRTSMANLAANAFAYRNLIAPYGALLFALSGAGVIPDVVAVLGRRERIVRRAVVAGTLIPACLYALFAFGVVGISGAHTSREAIAGLAPVLGSKIVVWGSIAGLLAIITSLIALSENTAALLRIDFGVSDRAAWILVSTVPFALYIAGLQDFIAIIGAVGALAFGIDALLIVAVYNRMRKRHHDPLPLMQRIAECLLCVIVIAGIAAYFYR